MEHMCVLVEHKERKHCSDCTCVCRSLRHGAHAQVQHLSRSFGFYISTVVVFPVFHFSLLSFPSAESHH